MDLYEAVKHGDVERLQKLLTGKHLDGNAGAYELLKLALEQEDFAICQELVCRGAPLAGQEKLDQNTLLHRLARVESTPCDFHREWNLFKFTMELLEGGLSVMDLNERDETPIHVAAKHGSAKNLYLFVDELMGQPDRLYNVVDYDGLSLFHIICTMPYTSYVIEFFQNVPNINMDDEVSHDSKFFPGYTALHFAAAHYRFETVKLLVQLGADATAATTAGLTLLHLSCTMDHPEWLFHEVSRNVPEDSRWATIAFANLQITLQVRTALVEYLLEMDIGVNARDVNDHNPMYFVASANYMDSRMAITAPTFDETLITQVDGVLFHAQPELRAHHLSLMKALFENGSKRTDQTLALFESMYFYEIADDASPDLTEEMFKFLLEKHQPGANIVNENFFTPLHIATQKQRLMILRYFLEFCDDDCSKMANINTQDLFGNTPLHYANRRDTSYENYAIVTLFVKHGVDLNLRNDKGMTGFIALRRLVLYTSDKEDFSAIARNEATNIELALSCKTNDSPNKCNFFMEALIIIWKHLIILKMCDAPTRPGHDEFLSEIEDFILISKNIINSGLKFKFFCADEVRKLKELHISKFTCLKDILINDIHDIAVCTKNEVLVNVIKSPELDRRFPIYKNLLRARFISGLARSKLLDKATASLKHLIKQDLPSFCLHKMLSYLNDKQLSDIERAGVSISKRKRTHDN